MEKVDKVMFELNNVSKQYAGEYVLRQVSLTLGKGMNFIVGASGSGKTTLLKLLAGMEGGYEGEIRCGGQDVSRLTPEQKGYFYNHVLGFVWQDFHLLEEQTVAENLRLPGALHDDTDQDVGRVLRRMKLGDLADQKVRLLSGGQKQRVAIARELMKDPQVILADEPTSALDQESAAIIMEVLRSLAKTRTVVVVTHDTSLIESKDRVVELDKGEVVADCTPVSQSKKQPGVRENRTYHLSLGQTFRLAAVRVKRRLGRAVTAAAVLLLSGVLLLTACGGALDSGGNAEFQKLLNTYGETILDISLAGSFMGAGGTDGSTGGKPNTDVTQDISGLYQKYAQDQRVEFALFEQAFGDISVTLGGKSYRVESSGSVPVYSKLLAGNFPNGTGNEVLLPEAFVRQAGKTPASILGETIEFQCTIVNWDTGEPVSMPAKISAEVVGVAENRSTYEYEGQVNSYTVDDSFFFSEPALKSLREQAEVDNKPANFVIRAKTPADLIAIKDELNENGIVPLGRFELLEDLVRLQEQTMQLSGGTSAVLAGLSVAAVVAVSLLTTFLRKKEYAIYAINGYRARHLAVLNGAETVLYAAVGTVLMLAASPALDLVTRTLFHFRLLQVDRLVWGVGLLWLMAALYAGVSLVPIVHLNLAKELKTGEHR